MYIERHGRMSPSNANKNILELACYYSKLFRHCEHTLLLVIFCFASFFTSLYDYAENSEMYTLDPHCHQRLVAYELKTSCSPQS